MVVTETTGEGVIDGSDEFSSGEKTSRSERESTDAERCRALRVLAELYPLGLRCRPDLTLGGMRLLEETVCFGAGGGLLLEGL